MLNSNWKSELYQLLLWLVLAAAIGWPLGFLPWALAIAAAVYS